VVRGRDRGVMGWEGTLACPCDEAPSVSMEPAAGGGRPVYPPASAHVSVPGPFPLVHMYVNQTRFLLRLIVFSPSFFLRTNPFNAASHAVSRLSGGRRQFAAMFTSRSCGSRDWVRIPQKKVCVARCLSPNPDFLHASPKTSTGPPQKGHGQPSQSVGSKGTPGATSVTWNSLHR